MSLRLEMLQVARLATNVLGESSGLVRDFLFGEIHEEGGFKDREGKPDLYYTVFGISALLALRESPPSEKIRSYLESIPPETLDSLVDLSSWIRCCASLSETRLPEGVRETLVTRLGQFRSEDGGFHPRARQAAGTVYGCFLALGAYQDLGADLPSPEGVCRFVQSMRCADGGYSNQANRPVGSTSATAAALSVLRHLEPGNPPEGGDWLRSQFHRQGGFIASPVTPLPDLLSTATALHALAGLGYPFEDVKEACLDFIDSLWTSRGSFYGHWADDTLDCEYTFYGLLALGHLSL